MKVVGGGGDGLGRCLFTVDKGAGDVFENLVEKNDWHRDL